MFKLLVLGFLYFTTIFANDVQYTSRSRGVTLKPLSTCCNIPELGKPKPLTECSAAKVSGPCNDVQCIFEKSGFLTESQELNKEAYKSHLRQWAEDHPGWNDGVERVISDCVDKNIRQYLDVPCKAYDVFTCTGITMIKVNIDECCPLPPFFKDEDFEQCGFVKMDGPPPPGPPDCSKQICIFKKYGLLKDEENVDPEAFNGLLDKMAAENPIFEQGLVQAKEKCVTKNIPGPPELCEGTKLLGCVGSTLFMECPAWAENDDCSKLKSFIQDCREYFS